MPRNTPPRDLARVLGEDSRPHSFHAPDSWNYAPGMQPSFDLTQATPPRSTPQSQSRLGILPSPAKSAFSSQEKEAERDIPPVPPLPDAAAEGQYQPQGTTQGAASHMMLQSIMRHSTPPVPAKDAEEKLAGMPVSDAANFEGFAGLDGGQAPPTAPAVSGRRHMSFSVDEAGKPPPLLQALSEPASQVASNPPSQHAQVDDDDDDDLPPQLNHDPLPLATKPQLGEISSAILFARPPQILDVSDEDDDGKSHRATTSAMLQAPGGGPSAGDISPLLPPIKSPLEDVNFGEDGGQPESKKTTAIRCDTASPVSSRGKTDGKSTSSDLDAEKQAMEAPQVGAARQQVTSGPKTTEKRPSFETSLMGSDISPISTTHSREVGDGDDAGAAPKLAMQKVRRPKRDLPPEAPRSTGQNLPPAPVSNPSAASAMQVDEIAVDEPGPATRRGSLSPGRSSPPHLHANAAADPTDDQTRRVSAMPFQVVHAVEEYAASNSSLASWDYDSTAARSHSDASHPDDMRDESDLVTPVAQVPRTTQNGPQVHQAGAQDNDTSTMAAPTEYFGGNATTADPNPPSQQLLPSAPSMAVPERSKSLLSQISAMVSEGGNPVSPASSIAGRSTPSTIRRMQHDPSAKTSWTPAQIPEESIAAGNDSTPKAKDDDFDLYADHNGIVKDVHDESGQPLRVGDSQVSARDPPSSPPKPAPPASALVVAAAEEPKNEDRPRYSTERPMSFISGPPDQDGKPQDQINQFTAQSDKNEERSSAQLSDIPVAGPTQLQQPLPLGDTSVSSDSTNNRAFDGAKTQMAVTSPHQNPSSEPISTPGLAARRTMNSEMPQNGQLPIRGPHDPRMYNIVPGQPNTQDAPTSGQMLMPDHDPRAQGQPLGPNSRPRNQYEFHQQMMQLQAKYPGSQGSHNHTPSMVGQQPNSQAPKPPEKPSSKPRLSSVFKGFGKSHAFQQSSKPKSAVDASLKPLPTDPNRNGSFHSAVSSISLSQDTTPIGIQGERSSSFGPGHRPPSMGAESHLSHLSQGSTRVQPTDSRLDLRKPASPSPFYGIPPQQPPSGSQIPNSQLQSQHVPSHAPASTSGSVEAGKKKRFSSLGGLFSRTGLGDGQSTKIKLSKDEKKALKAQKHATAPPIQAPAPQWPQQHARHPGMVYPPGQGPPPHTVNGVRPLGPPFASPQSMSPIPQNIQGSQSFQGIPQQRFSQQHAQSQTTFFTPQPSTGLRPEDGSAYLRTRQLAEEHKAQRNLTQPPVQRSQLVAQTSNASVEQPPHPRQPSSGPPPGGYYKPEAKKPIADEGVYAPSEAAQRALQERRQDSTYEPTAYGASQLERSQLQRRQQSMSGQDMYPDSHAERLQAQQPRQPVPDQTPYATHQAEPSPANQPRAQPAYDHAPYGSAQANPQSTQSQREQQIAKQIAYQNALAQRQIAERQRQQPIPGPGGHGLPQGEPQLAQQQRQQIEQQAYYSQQQQRQSTVPPFNYRSVSGPVTGNEGHIKSNVSQRHVSSPTNEPQYEAPPIPAAYNPVSGAFISPRDRQQQPLFSPASEPSSRPLMDQYGRQYSDPRMPSISPQISAQSIPPNSRTHSDASTVSMVSPISNTQDMAMTSPPTNQRPQKPRMSSISEVRLQEQPWHLNFPQGATEQEIVRARQRQYMEQQFSAQQQLHAERAAQASPRIFPHEHSPIPEGQRQGGFKEVLPRNSPQPYPLSQAAQPSQQEQSRVSENPQPVQPAPIHPDQLPQPAAYPLPKSPDAASKKSPVNPLADALPPPPILPPKIAHSPIRPMFPPTSQPLAERQQQQQQQQPIDHAPQQAENTPPPPADQPQYEQPVPDEPPPSYDGPGVPNDGMDKSRPEQPRPPNIVTETEPDERGRQQDPRQRQPSIGILQHPQPASMAASPQRSSADMGAESLRRQLLQQEEHARMERIQRAQIQRDESERERQEREKARARARELELSVSSGGRVGSLRSVGGSRNGGTSGWERRGSTSRQVFELPAVEDDEPTMKATSYPGQEWVPPMWTDD